jgi:hypothetical protein
MRKMFLFLALASCDPVEAEPPTGRCDPTKDFAPAVRIDELSNEVSSDQDARMNDAETLLVFAREWPEGTGKLDLHWSSRASAEERWSAPSVVGFEAVNGLDQQRAPSLADDGLTLYYSNYVETVRYDIMVSTRPSLDAAWGTPVPVAGMNLPEVNDRDAWFVPDGSAVYFASERGGAGYRLYRATRSPGGGYSQVVHLDELDVPGGQTFTPVVSADELTIYFSSQRDEPATPADIFRATRASKNERFGQPVYLTTLNTIATDVATWVSADDCVMLLRSERPDNSHRSDLYVATRPR